MLRAMERMRENHVEKFKEWLRLNLKDFQWKEHKNMPVAGQHVHDSHRLTEEMLIVVTWTSEASPSILQQTLAALSLGMGVSVLARNQQAFDYWMMIWKYFRDASWPRESFRIFQAGQKNALETVAHEKVCCMAVDGTQKQTEEISRRAWEGGYEKKTVKKIFTPYDTPPLSDPGAYLHNLVLIRSFAVNTMRYGAPLSLEY